MAGGAAGAGAEGFRGTVPARPVHEPSECQSTTLVVRIRRYRCIKNGQV